MIKKKRSALTRWLTGSRPAFVPGTGKPDTDGCALGLTIRLLMEVAREILDGHEVPTRYSGNISTLELFEHQVA